MAGVEAGELEWYPLSKVSNLGTRPGLSGIWRLDPCDALLRELFKGGRARVKGVLLLVLHMRARSEPAATALCLRLLCFSVGN